MISLNKSLIRFSLSILRVPVLLFIKNLEYLSLSESRLLLISASCMSFLSEYSSLSRQFCLDIMRSSIELKYEPPRTFSISCLFAKITFILVTSFSKKSIYVFNVGDLLVLKATRCSPSFSFCFVLHSLCSFLVLTFHCLLLTYRCCCSLSFSFLMELIQLTYCLNLHMSHH